MRLIHLLYHPLAHPPDEQQGDDVPATGELHEEVIQEDKLVDPRRLRDTPARQQPPRSALRRHNRATRGVHFAHLTTFRRSTRSITLGDVQSRLNSHQAAQAASAGTSTTARDTKKQKILNVFYQAKN